MRFGATTSVLLLAALSSFSSAALAQDVALDRFEPAPAGDALFAAGDPGVNGHWLPAAALVLSYARSPLVLRQVGAAEDSGVVVTHQLVTHAQGSLELWRRLQVEVSVPVTLSQAGEDPSVGTVQFESPSGASFNDVRMGLKLNLLQDDSAVSAALAATAWLPSGDDGAYTGSGETRYAGSVLLGGDYERWLWRFALGRRVQPRRAEAIASLGSDLTFNAGAAFKVLPVQLGAELHGSTRRSEARDLFATATTPLEALASARVRVGMFVFGAGAGPGLTRAPGTPSYRVLLSAAVAPEQARPPRPSADADRRSAESAVGSEAAPVGGAGSGLAPGAQERDRDGDGVVDAEDRCPEVGGSKADGGCPPDGDGDGIFDFADGCPKQAGVPSLVKEKHGCPADRDGDGIVDAQDACPEEKGIRSEDPKTNGCPESVRVEGTQIVILQQVNFKTGKADIDPGSHALLSQVASVLADHPEIARVAVDGHTDNVGRAQANLALSRLRALAVMRWLVHAGVDERRLEARGFGPRQPIADNKTDAGRAKNRRVEFQILRRTKQGKRGWKDGAANE